MPGKRINHKQSEFYLKMRNENKGNTTQKLCAIRSGMSERTARTIDKGKHHTNKPPKVRNYKTRESRIDEVWERDLEPMLSRDPDLQPMTIFLYMERTYLDSNNYPIYDASVLRSLQRKVKKWNAINGKDTDIIIPQKHYPGVQGLSDFTHMNSLGITIGKTPFKHMLYHFRLVYSKYSYVKVILGGESFQALSEGLQEALAEIGGSPKEHRTDSLSAAFKNDNHIPEHDLTDRYSELCLSYSMKPTRNNKGVSHENGSVESAHAKIKNRIKQELRLRGSADFNTVEDYEIWIKDIIATSNRRNSRDFKGEQSALQPLPKMKGSDYEIKSVKVSTLGMINVKGMVYSVPTRLVGNSLTLHIKQKIIEGYIGSSLVITLDRVYARNVPLKYIIDYKHLISSFVKKPNAFRTCKYREELLPNDNFRMIWKHLDDNYESKVAVNMILRLLKLCADHNCEPRVAEQFLYAIDKSQEIDIVGLENQYNTANPKLPEEKQYTQHNLSSYDNMIPPVFKEYANAVA